MNDDRRRPITLEDLLRLKRAERPPAEFWAQFDRELRAKQLAALVEKRPWWRRLPQAFSGYTRYHLPLGATAVLALTFLATRDPRPATVSLEPVVTTGTTQVATVAEMRPAPELAHAITGLAAENPPTGAVTVATSVEAPREDPEIADEESGPVSRFAGFFTAPEEITPSARTIAANLAAAHAEAPMVVRGLLGSARGFESRVLPARSPAVEPLAQMTTPAERSRARLMSAMAVSFSGDVSPRTSERVARRLSDDRLRDEVRRFDATGNTVALRF